MKQTSVIWYILGAIVLIGLGFVVGFVLNGGVMGAMALRGAAVAPFATRSMVAPGPFFFGPRFGFGALILAYLCLGPLAGFAALFIVLTRRPAQVGAPASAPAAHVETPPAPLDLGPQPEAPDKK